MMDRYGREITSQGNGAFSVGGITVEADSAENALRTFNAMAPGDWIEQIIPESLDPVGALATLLAVTETLTVQDAANAVRLLPEQLISEAEAWAAAQNINS